MHIEIRVGGLPDTGLTHPDVLFLRMEGKGATHVGDTCKLGLTEVVEGLGG